ncbi:hypothetical protein [Luteimonas sp. MC1750]|uniref:hypothetical protein n=1 Tax=Luteimonas sp. MC1750 TaxID=2799326 RepID=UPI0018F0705F|nr:hypothetical protein [Luteimonas sp. MC1750]MBJ6984000.1 hypothetical protein [Luteimonas sp. MC1750]QQO06812.1 hypothetical protein JGR68_05140 [Luteimonas sp. MC1750]
MSFEQTVSTLRTNASSTLLDTVVGSFPSAGDIEPWAHLSPVLWPDLPANDDARREQLPVILAQYSDELAGYITRFEDLRTRRLDALSNYDIGIAYRQMGPEVGLAQALTAVAGHIGRARAQILWLLTEQARLTPPQLALF